MIEKGLTHQGVTKGRRVGKNDRCGLGQAGGGELKQKVGDPGLIEGD